MALARPGQTLISFLYPAQNADLLERCKAKGVTVIAMDMVPRICRAQKMDALSSMANIAGYRAVIEAGNNFGRFFTGQVTAAGKVPPAKVLVVGAGVAGLAAIGTATSLGAITYAFDVRPEVAEQIEFMGAEFVFLDFAEQQQDGAATGGYAAPSSARSSARSSSRNSASWRRTWTSSSPRRSSPGRPAPKLWTEDMVEAMKPGSVIVDLAAERGGNCDLTVPDQTIVTDERRRDHRLHRLPEPHGDAVLDALRQQHPPHDGRPDPGQGRDAVVNMEDDVIRGATVTYDGAITFPPPPPKIQAIARSKPKPKPGRRPPSRRRRASSPRFSKSPEPAPGAAGRRHGADAAHRHAWRR